MPCTHWAMRRLADQLARTGAHVLRFDYFATGDSAGATGDGNVKRLHDDIRANETAWSSRWLSITRIVTGSVDLSFLPKCVQSCASWQAAPGIGDAESDSCARES